MEQDLKKLFKNEQKVSNQKMSEGHLARFLNKLDEALPETLSQVTTYVLEAKERSF